MLHKYRKTGNGLLGLIDKHIHATVTVIISTSIILTIVVVNNFIGQEKDYFAYTNMKEVNELIQEQLSKNVDIPVSLDDIEEAVIVADNESGVQEVKNKKQISVTYYDIPLSTELQDLVRELCEDYGNVEETLVYAVIKQESNFNPDALGDSGKSKGLMQIQQCWHEARMNKLGVTSLMDAEGNIRVGIDILSEKIKKYNNDLGKALTAYNAGDAGAYNYYFSKGIYANTYAQKILVQKDKFKIKKN